MPDQAYVYYILFPDIILILLIDLVLNPEKLWECLLSVRHHVFCLWFHAWNLLYVKSPQKKVTNVSLILKDSDTELENLISLIWLPVLDDQKTDRSKDVSKDVSFIRRQFKRCIIYHMTSRLGVK